VLPEISFAARCERQEGAHSLCLPYPLGFLLPVLARLDAARRAGKRPREDARRARRSAAEGEASESPYEVLGTIAASLSMMRIGPVPQTGHRALSTPVRRLIRSGTDSSGCGASGAEGRQPSNS
jgi:hypothetical protein